MSATLLKKDFSIHEFEKLLRFEKNALFAYFKIDISCCSVEKIGLNTFLLNNMNSEKPEILVRIIDNKKQPLCFELLEEKLNFSEDNIRELLACHRDQIVSNIGIDIQNYTLRKIGSSKFLLETLDDPSYIFTILNLNGTLEIMYENLYSNTTNFLTIYLRKNKAPRRVHKNKYKIKV